MLQGGSEPRGVPPVVCRCIAVGVVGDVERFEEPAAGGPVGFQGADAPSAMRRPLRRACAWRRRLCRTSYSSSRAMLPATSTSCGWDGRSLSSKTSQTLAARTSCWPMPCPRDAGCAAMSSTLNTAWTPKLVVYPPHENGWRRVRYDRWHDPHSPETAGETGRAPSRCSEVGVKRETGRWAARGRRPQKSARSRAPGSHGGHAWGCGQQRIADGPTKVHGRGVAATPGAGRHLRRQHRSPRGAYAVSAAHAVLRSSNHAPSWALGVGHPTVVSTGCP